MWSVFPKNIYVYPVVFGIVGEEVFIIVFFFSGMQKDFSLSLSHLSLSLSSLSLSSLSLHNRILQQLNKKTVFPQDTILWFQWEVIRQFSI